MRFAKLIDGNLNPAPNPIEVAGNYIGNPPDEIYLQEGYLYVHTVSCPIEDPEPGYMWSDSWIEENGYISQVWNQVEIPEEPEISAEEALDIIFGGEEA